MSAQIIHRQKKSHKGVKEGSHLQREKIENVTKKFKSTQHFHPEYRTISISKSVRHISGISNQFFLQNIPKLAKIFFIEL